MAHQFNAKQYVEVKNLKSGGRDLSFSPHIDAALVELELVELLLVFCDFRLNLIDSRGALLQDVDLVTVRAHRTRVLRQLQVLHTQCHDVNICKYIYMYM